MGLQATQRQWQRQPSAHQFIIPVAPVAGARSAGASGARMATPCGSSQTQRQWQRPAPTPVTAPHQCPRGQFQAQSAGVQEKEGSKGLKASLHQLQRQRQRQWKPPVSVPTVVRRAGMPQPLARRRARGPPNVTLVGASASHATSARTGGPGPSLGVLLRAFPTPWPKSCAIRRTTRTSTSTSAVTRALRDQ